MAPQVEVKVPEEARETASYYVSSTPTIWLQAQWSNKDS